MSIHGKNLITKVLDLEGTGSVYKLEFNPDRTFLALEDVTGEGTRDVRVWVGQDINDLRTDHWPTLKDFRFDYGCAGPIYLVELGGQNADIAVISSIPEKLAVQLQLEDFLKRDELTTNGGDPLTTVAADLLYTTDPQFTPA